MFWHYENSFDLVDTIESVVSLQQSVNHILRRTHLGRGTTAKEIIRQNNQGFYMNVSKSNFLCPMTLLKDYSTPPGDGECFLFNTEGFMISQKCS